MINNNYLFNYIMNMKEYKQVQKNRIILANINWLLNKKNAFWRREISILIE